MHLITGNMFIVLNPEYRGLFLVTGNSIVKPNNELVMGAGAALAMKVRFPGLPLLFGNKLLNIIDYCRSSEYNVMYDCSLYPWCLGVFQTKFDYKYPSPLDLIRRSTELLGYMAADWERIDLNFPGINFGRQKREDVLPIVEQLPSNVYIWEYDYG